MISRLASGVPSPRQIRGLFVASRGNPRDHLLLRLLYGTGLRREEAVTLRAGDVLWDVRTVFIRSGKGNKDRYVLMDPATCELLRAWLAGAPPQQRIFPHTGKWLRETVLIYAERSGLLQEFQQLGLRFSPHSLRYAFATHRYEGGLPFLTVANLLGHVLPQDTVTYVGSASRQVDSAYDSCNPFGPCQPRSSRPSGGPAPTPAGDREPPWLEEWRLEFAQQPGAARVDGLPAVPSPGEMVELLRQAEGPGMPYRLLRFLYATGLTLEECLPWRPEELDWQPGCLVVRGRRLFLDPETYRLLRGAESVFPAEAELFRQQLGRWAERTGLAQRLEAVGRPLSCDILRYAFATHCSARGMDPITLMNLLRHRHYATTNAYQHCAIYGQLAAFDAAGCQEVEP